MSTSDNMTPPEPPTEENETPGSAENLASAHETLTALTIQLEALQAQNSHLQGLQKDAALRRAVADWAIDPELVLTMTQADFKVDETGAVYAQQTDETEASERQTAGDYYQRFMREKPYLVKSSGTVGAGSYSQSGGRTPAKRASIDELAEMPMAQFIRHGGLSGGGSSNH